MTDFSFARRVVAYMQPRNKLKDCDGSDIEADSDDGAESVAEETENPNKGSTTDGKSKNEAIVGDLVEIVGEHEPQTNGQRRLEKSHSGSDLGDHAKDKVNPKDTDDPLDHKQHIKENQLVSRHNQQVALPGRRYSVGSEEEAAPVHDRSHRRSSIKFEGPESTHVERPESKPVPEAQVDEGLIAVPITSFQREHLPAVLRVPLSSQIFQTPTGMSYDPYITTKSRKKKEDFRKIMNRLEIMYITVLYSVNEIILCSLVKSEERAYGLPPDVFNGAQGGLSLSDSVKFLSISSSNKIFKDLKAKKKKNSSSKIDKS